jgi:hypothetical protein
MKILKLIFLIIIIGSCSESQKQTNLSETERWKLGWRMESSSWDNDHQLVENQFDSLLVQNNKIEYKFLITGLKSLHELGNAVKKGDMDGQSYAYLYDRIKMNSGEKQLYGTQFADVDAVNGTVTLAETEDMDNLDHRRMEIGMMPIEMYKELMLKNIQN